MFGPTSHFGLLKYINVAFCLHQVVREFKHPEGFEKEDIDASGDGEFWNYV